MLFMSGACCYGDEIPASAQLKVPLVEQGKGALCGPACIQMVLRYWKVRNHSQHDIARAILHTYPDLKRVKKSKVLEDPRIIWKKYPGTGTSTMRDFLRQFAKTKNLAIRHMDEDSDESVNEAKAIFHQIKEAIADGVPVLVHQYWKGPGSTGHYRVVTGYDDRSKFVTLNDPKFRKPVRQRYDEFYRKSNVDEEWLHFNSIIFNYDKAKLSIDSLMPAATKP